jgi:hypothetical protein
VGAGLAPRSGSAQPAVLVSHVVVAVWLVANAISQTGWRRVGIGLALTGWLLNLAVMLPNGGMPVSMDAVASIQGADHGVDPTDGYLAKHVPLDDDTVLPGLADIHPLPRLRLIYSVGDVVLAGGLVLTFVASVGSIRPRRRVDAGGADEPAEVTVDDERHLGTRLDRQPVLQLRDP